MSPTRKTSTAARTAKPAPTTSARRAGLRYVTDGMPGIRRLRAGESFRYQKGNRRVGDAATLARIRSLAIPPAWADVWICPKAHGHLQATGRDARGRKQHRYHPRWREVRDASKFDRLLDFAGALPAIRGRVSRDLARSNHERERVLATVVRLMDLTFIRVGNEEYARDNKSFGLTTLKDRHAAIRGGTIRLQFRGKSGKAHDISVADPRLARTVKRCRDIPGQDLFQYYEEGGKRRAISSGDVNGYLREVGGKDFSSRDFRTWAGTVLALQLIQRCRAGKTEGAAKKVVAGVVEQVAGKLGNTVAVCRKSYIHPSVFDHYIEGRLSNGSVANGHVPEIRDVKRPRTGLAPAERDALRFLRRCRAKRGGSRRP